jgi:hypothetical protein
MCLVVVLAVCLSLAQSFSLRSSSSRVGSSSLKMAWKAAETDEHFLIAPSILSADFARLGEEVKLYPLSTIGFKSYRCNCMHALTGGERPRCRS